MSGIIGASLSELHLYGSDLMYETSCRPIGLDFFPMGSPFLFFPGPSVAKCVAYNYSMKFTVPHTAVGSHM